ncbi:RNA polymerase sigma factor sigC [Striga hermonthica]|uniref:RNA polymerase sigma factor sigC n=1 Tax=Striga hermonthica TaxID=68872 RepID=A0A9N7MKY4_STRHE|nr:RNA polymerase sigma factor sigC [Striga hermonthica]
MGFRLNLKWCGLSVQSPLSTTTSSWPTSFSCMKRDSSYCWDKLSAASVLYGEAEMLNDDSRERICSSSPQLLEDYYLRAGESKVALGNGSGDDLYILLDKDNEISKIEDKQAHLTSLQSSQASQYGLLMKNLDELEELFAYSNDARLEKDIMEQLERLGALRFFHSCLSRTLESSTYSNLCNAHDEIIVGEHRISDRVGKLFIQSGKKEMRKLRRNKKIKKEGERLDSISREVLELKFGLPSRKRGRSPRSNIARIEADMSSGVKMVAKLEKLRVMLEDETGQIASPSDWAKVAGFEKNELRQHLHYGWYCRDELLKSTRSLVIFISKNYWGLGVPFEDLVQAGSMGVLKGAERFDRTRGYKFSTYVQYWIRKSMSTLVAKHGRGVRIPCTLSMTINQVQKARKALCASNGKYPDDTEIARFTGLSMAKIKSANKCLRVVGSIDHKIGEGINVDYMEITPDKSILSPEESFIRQQMIKDLYTLLNGLGPTEKQVIILRFGLGNNQRKSLDEIGRIFRVSKEWIRRKEKSALTKLRSEDCIKFLNHYAYMKQI